MKADEVGKIQTDNVIMNELKGMLVESHNYSLRDVQRKPKKYENAGSNIPHSSNYKAWKTKLKSDSMKYAAFKQDDAIRSRLYRANLSDDKRNICNQGAKMRMRKYRERHGKPERKVQTRKQVDKEREYWRNKKREQRVKMSAQARRRELEKRRDLYKSNKCKRFLDFKSVNQETPKSKIIKNPIGAEAFAIKIESLVKNATREKKDALQRIGFIFTPKLKEKHKTNAKIASRIKTSLRKLKGKHDKTNRHTRRLLTRAIVGKYGVDNKLRRELSIKWEYWNRVSCIEEENAKRSDAMPEESRQHIERFYLNESVTLPDKKYVSAKTGKQKQVLTESLQQAHVRYLQENPDKKVSLSHFQKLRPKEVLTVNTHTFVGCLCEYCLNVQYKLDSINTIAQKLGKPYLKLNSKYTCLDVTLCSKDSNSTFHKRQCINRECSVCGMTALKEHYKPLLEEDRIQTDATYEWKRWQYTEIQTSLKKSVKRQTLVDKKGSLQDLIDELCTAVEPLAKHLFVARWQYNQFLHLTKNVPENWLVMVADFAENYRCTHQDEISAAYYQYQQVTLHPIVTYYNCPNCEDVVHLTAIFIAADLIHDAHAVNKFTDTLTSHIQNQAVSVSHVVQFSDGCSCQYKSKLPFQFLSEKGSKFERAYFGSRHGKGPCDAAGGVVKKAAEMYVKSRQGTIRDAKEFFEFSQSRLQIGASPEVKCIHKKRIFFYSEVERTKQTETLRTLPGTRTIHSARGIESGVLEARELSCFCSKCQQGMSDACENRDVVGEWKSHMITTSKATKRKTSIHDKPTDGEVVNWGERDSRSTTRNAVSQEDTAKRFKRGTSTSKVVKATKAKHGARNKGNNADGNKKTGDITKVDAETDCTYNKPTDDDGVHLRELDRSKSRNAGSEENTAKKLKWGTSTSKDVITRKAKDDAQDKGNKGDENKKKSCESNKIDAVGKDKLNIRQLKATLESDQLPELPKSEDRSFVNTCKSIDKISTDLVPVELPLTSEVPMFPCQIYGDGNCLPRCASVIAYGTENKYEEMRDRIAMEMIANRAAYLDNETMRRGKHHSGNENVTRSFAMYSSEYMGERLTNSSIRKIYDKEILNISMPGVWMGLWQFAALASILSRPIASVCPTYGSHTVRDDMHRIFYPVREQHTQYSPVYIMWSNTSGCSIPEREFAFNHFVPLMPMTVDMGGELWDNADELNEQEDDDTPFTLDIEGLLDILDHPDSNDLQADSGPVIPVDVTLQSNGTDTTSEKTGDSDDLDADSDPCIPVDVTLQSTGSDTTSEKTGDSDDLDADSGPFIPVDVTLQSTGSDTTSAKTGESDDLDVDSGSVIPVDVTLQSTGTDTTGEKTGDSDDLHADSCPVIPVDVTHQSTGKDTTSEKTGDTDDLHADSGLVIPVDVTLQSTGTDTTGEKTGDSDDLHADSCPVIPVDVTHQSTGKDTTSEKTGDTDDLHADSGLVIPVDVTLQSTGTDTTGEKTGDSDDLHADSCPVIPVDVTHQSTGKDTTSEKTGDTDDLHADSGLVIPVDVTVQSTGTDTTSEKTGDSDDLHADSGPVIPVDVTLPSTGTDNTSEKIGDSDDLDVHSGPVIPVDVTLPSTGTVTTNEKIGDSDDLDVHSGPVIPVDVTLPSTGTVTTSEITGDSDDLHAESGPVILVDVTLPSTGTVNTSEKTGDSDDLYVDSGPVIPVDVTLPSTGTDNTSEKTGDPDDLHADSGPVIPVDVTHPSTGTDNTSEKTGDSDDLDVDSGPVIPVDVTLPSTGTVTTNEVTEDSDDLDVDSGSVIPVDVTLPSTGTVTTSEITGDSDDLHAESGPVIPVDMTLQSTGTDTTSEKTGDSDDLDVDSGPVIPVDVTLPSTGTDTTSEKTGDSDDLDVDSGPVIPVDVTLPSTGTVTTNEKTGDSDDQHAESSPVIPVDMTLQSTGTDNTSEKTGDSDDLDADSGPVIPVDVTHPSTGTDTTSEKTGDSDDLHEDSGPVIPVDVTLQSTGTDTTSEKTRDSDDPHAESCPVIPVDVMLQSTGTDTTRYRMGDYIMVQHGASLFPAVVEDWPWVTFYSKARKKNMWSLNVIKHTVEDPDVKFRIDPPAVTMYGRSRVLFKFPDQYWLK